MTIEVSSLPMTKTKTIFAMCIWAGLAGLFVQAQPQTFRPTFAQLEKRAANLLPTKAPLQGQGLWVVAPDGTVLGGMSAEIDGHPSERAGNGPGATWKANPKFTDAVLEMLDKSLEKHGPVTLRTEKAKPLPFRGAGVK